MKNILRIMFIVFSLALFSITSVAQQPVAPPPKPVNDAPANAAVLKLLQAGMPESVVLEKIHAITDTFDTSIDALVTLKQAGATEAELKAIMARGAAPAEQPPAASADTGPSLAETMQFIQVKLKEQGQIEFVETVSVQNQPGVTIRISVRSKDDDVVADPATCTLHAAGTYDQNIVTSAGGKTVATEDQHSYLAGTVAFKNVEKITVENMLDFSNRHFAESGHPEFTTTVATPVFFVELSAAKPLFTRHESNTIGNQAPVVTDRILKQAGLLFRDEEMADRIAKAMLHAIELCGGGNKEPF